MIEQNILSEKEIRRYETQIKNPYIGKYGQEKIKNANVIIIGAGSIGTAVLQHLSTLGIGTLGICDNSSIQENKLSTQLLFGNSDLGKQKAITSKQKLQDVNHLVKYELHNVLLNENNSNIICNTYDIIIDATDNFETHYLINDYALESDKPFIFSCIDVSSAIISIFNYQGGPSLRCLYPEKPDMQSSMLNYNLCKVSLAGIIAGIIANEVIKVILGITTKLCGNLLLFKPDDYLIEFKKINRNPKNFSF